MATTTVRVLILVFICNYSHVMKSQSAEITFGEFLFQSEAKIDGLENAIKSETCEKCIRKKYY